MFRFTMTAALALLAGCSSGTGYRAFQSEAGAAVNTGNFGNSTMNNTLVMTGRQGHTHALATRFASEVDSTVNFAFNSARLDAEAQRTLARQAHWIRQFPEVRLRVYGHTDAVGSAAYNKWLGLRRAQSVVQFLTTQGIGRARLEAVASFGETQPLIVTQGRERRNRRTVTEVAGFVKGHPMLLDGRYAQVVYREYVESAEPKSQLRTLEQSGAALKVE